MEQREVLSGLFRTTVSEQKKNWVLSVQNLMKMHNNPQQVMGLIGEDMKGNIAQSIATWSDPPMLYSGTERFSGSVDDTMQMLEY